MDKPDRYLKIHPDTERRQWVAHLSSPLGRERSGGIGFFLVCSLVNCSFFPRTVRYPHSVERIMPNPSPSSRVSRFIS